MSKTQNYVEAVRTMLNDDDNRHTLSVALTGVAILSKSAPELFDDDPLIPGTSEATNRAVQVAVGGLHALTQQGILPEEGAREGMIEVFRDTQLTMILVGTAIELLNTIDNDPDLVAKLEAAGEDYETAAQAVKDSELGGLVE